MATKQEAIALLQKTKAQMTAFETAVLSLADADMTDESLPGVSEALIAARENLTSLPVPGEAWDAEKRYIAGDTVTVNGVLYTALKYSKGKDPQSSPQHWEADSGTPAYQDWDSIEDGTVIEAGTIVTYHGDTWICTSQHIKSTVYKPKEGSSKWEAYNA